MAGESSSNEQSRKRKQGAPKPGEQGYLTPTQLRNARKRRAKKQKSNYIREKTTDKKSAKQPCSADPSSLYASNPRKAPIVQQAQNFFKDKIDSFPIHLGPTTGWRTVAKLAVRSSGEDGGLTIGLFEPGSHRLVAVPDCPAHHPSINQAVAAVQRSARKLKVPAFDEATGEGCFRHVALSVERSTGTVQITLVWKDATEKTSVETPKNQPSLLDRFCSSLIEKGSNSTKGSFQIHSLWVHYNSSWKHANAIFSIRDGRWEHRHGPEHGTVEYLDGFPTRIPLYFPPTVFRQANLDAFGTIVAEIRRYLEESKFPERSQNCVELYGGVGTIGLHLADICQSLICSDENPHNSGCFNKSLESLSFPNKNERVSYKPLCATNMVGPSLHQSNWIVVDPPRKGLDEPVVQALSSQCPEAKCLVYVSCGFEAFQRDYHVLTATGSWKLHRAAGYLLFPGSNAIETLAIFTK